MKQTTLNFHLKAKKDILWIECQIHKGIRDKTQNFREIFYLSLLGILPYITSLPSPYCFQVAHLNFGLSTKRFIL